jgi:hypothetical protein
MTKASSSFTKSAPKKRISNKSTFFIDVTSEPDIMDALTSRQFIPSSAPQGYKVASMTLKCEMSVTYELINPPPCASLEKICHEVARILNVVLLLGDVTIIPINEKEAHVCDHTGNEIFAVKRRYDLYDVVLFPRDHGKCYHVAKTDDVILTKAQRKAAPASLWSCINAGVIEGIWIKDDEVVCSLFRTCEDTEQGPGRISEFFRGWRDDHDDHDGDDRQHPNLFMPLEDIVSRINKPMYCVQNDCKALFCCKH